MLGETTLRDNLNILSNQYLLCRDPKLELFYSKLALLELCGWIEESMDGIAVGVIKRKVKNPAIVTRVEKNIIRKVNGFIYHDHFRVMLSKIIGEVGVYRLERKLNSKKFTVMCATLNNLKDPRNSQAHTHIKGTLLTIDSPSVTLANFNNVHPGLADIETKLKSMGY